MATSKRGIQYGSVSQPTPSPALQRETVEQSKGEMTDHHQQCSLFGVTHQSIINTVSLWYLFNMYLSRIMSHKPSSVTHVKHPSQGLRKIITGVNNTRNELHDNVTGFFPILNSKVLNLDVSSPFRWNLAVNHARSKDSVKGKSRSANSVQSGSLVCGGGVWNNDQLWLFVSLK